MKTINAFFFILVMLVGGSTNAIAGEYELSGNISDISSIKEGMIIMLDKGVPSNCEGTPYNWMLIKEENKTIISVVLAMLASKKTGFTLYTDPYSSESGEFCVINQADPHSLF